MDRKPMKEVSRLTIAELRLHPVWKFTGSDSRGETRVRPVARVPVRSLANCVVRRFGAIRMRWFGQKQDH